MDDYKKYSLGQLENFLHDCMNAETTTAQEIYDVIKSVVEENYYTYKNSASQAYELLALLNGNGKGHISTFSDTCDKDDPSPECKNSWTSFWEEPSMPPWGHSDLEGMAHHSGSTVTSVQYTEEELNAMCDAAEKQDKVKKWVLPVDNLGECYFVSFPDDLLEAANLKEGDCIEWHDQGDGSFKLIKKDN